MFAVGFYCISNRRHLAKYAIRYKGDSWDNTVAESFFHTLETGLTHQCKFKSRKESKNVIFEYIEGFITVSGFIQLMIIYHQQNLKH